MRATYKHALAKRALATQLKRAGSPKKEAEAIVARLTFRECWRKLPLHVRSDIAWQVLRHAERRSK